MSLAAVRDALDEVDERLVSLLAARAVLVEAAAREKEAAGLPVRDRAREEALLLRVPAGLPREMYSGILRASRRWQMRRRTPLPELISAAERDLDRVPAFVPFPATRAEAVVCAITILLLVIGLLMAGLL